MFEINMFRPMNLSPRGQLLITAATAVSAAACGGAASARLHAGPTATSDGEVEVVAGFAIAVGLPLSRDSAVAGSVGLASGTANDLELVDTIEYVTLPEDALGKRLGITTSLPLVGDQIAVFLHAGAMKPLRRHSRALRTTRTTVMAVGVQARLGLMARQLDVGEDTARLASGADLTLEWWLFGR